jgi:hypothetical protein
LSTTAVGFCPPRTSISFIGDGTGLPTGSHRRHRTRSPRALWTVLAGSYQAGLTQYRDIEPAAIRGSRVITTTDPPSRFTDRDIEAFLDVLFDAGVLPGPDAQAVYVVTIPPGIYSGEGDDLVGEHSYYRRDGHRVHYAWTTDSEVLDGATQTTTHEIVETLTDPEGTAILGTPGTCDGERWCEIADICSGGVKLHGVMVKPYWSNIGGHCVAPAPPALGASGDHLTASEAQPRLALPQDAVAGIGATNEHRGRAAKRRPTTRCASSTGSAPLTSQEAR